jgi:DNA-binding transcriptional regulator YdaS (Cro superfamily)
VCKTEAGKYGHGFTLQDFVYNAAIAPAKQEVRMQQADAIRRAIDSVGGLTELGEILGCTPQRIWNWTARGRPPVKVCPKIEAATGVPCEELRPDINWGYMRQKIFGANK